MTCDDFTIRESMVLQVLLFYVYILNLVIITSFIYPSLYSGL